MHKSLSYVNIIKKIGITKFKEELSSTLLLIQSRDSTVDVSTTTSTSQSKHKILYSKKSRWVVLQKLSHFKCMKL